jgi:hypothetical protein
MIGSFGRGISKSPLRLVGIFGTSLLDDLSVRHVVGLSTSEIKLSAALKTLQLLAVLLLKLVTFAYMVSQVYSTCVGRVIRLTEVST